MSFASIQGPRITIYLTLPGCISVPTGDIYTMELLLIPAAIASGCHRPLLRWLKTARPCTANGSELSAICGRLVVITARIKCTAVVVLDAVATNFVGRIVLVRVQM